MNKNICTCLFLFVSCGRVCARNMYYDGLPVHIPLEAPAEMQYCYVLCMHTLPQEVHKKMCTYKDLVLLMIILGSLRSNGWATCVLVRV